MDSPLPYPTFRDLAELPLHNTYQLDEWALQNELDQPPSLSYVLACIIKYLGLSNLGVEAADAVTMSDTTNRLGEVAGTVTL
jgi:hypothetical protein